jgi:hypothetical protein
MRSPVEGVYLYQTSYGFASVEIPRCSQGTLLPLRPPLEDQGRLAQGRDGPTGISYHFEIPSTRGFSFACLPRRCLAAKPRGSAGVRMVKVGQNNNGHMG